MFIQNRSYLIEGTRIFDTASSEKHRLRVDLIGGRCRHSSQEVIRFPVFAKLIQSQTCTA